MSLCPKSKSDCRNRVFQTNNAGQKYLFCTIAKKNVSDLTEKDLKKAKCDNGKPEEHFYQSGKKETNSILRKLEADSMTIKEILEAIRAHGYAEVSFITKDGVTDRAVVKVNVKVRVE